MNIYYIYNEHLLATNKEAKHLHYFNNFINENICIFVILYASDMKKVAVKLFILSMIYIMIAIHGN